jgi:hypothetical protein
VSTKAINPNAASIRAALKSAGLEDAVRKITTGTKVLYLYVSDSPQTAMAVVKALSPLWNDSDKRISSPRYGETVSVTRGERVATAIIEISRSDWEDTVPASVAVAEPERRLVAVDVRTEDSERAFQTKPRTYRLVPRSKCRRNRRSRRR